MRYEPVGGLLLIALATIFVAGLEVTARNIPLGRTRATWYFAGCALVIWAVLTLMHLGVSAQDIAFWSLVGVAVVMASLGGSRGTGLALAIRSRSHAKDRQSRPREGIAMHAGWKKDAHEQPDPPVARRRMRWLQPSLEQSGPSSLLAAEYPLADDIDPATVMMKFQERHGLDDLG